MYKFLLFLLLLLPCAVSAQDVQKEIVNLDVPFVSEAPQKIWSGVWINACEEASITAVDAFYLNQKNVTVKEATAFMNKLFAWENKTFKSNTNTNATRTIQMIVGNNLSFQGTIVREPTLNQIKEELRAGRPVISLHYGLDLHNPSLIFRRGGSAYHMIVIKGFDETMQEFIVQDNGSHTDGIDFRYSYDTLMSSLHDYNHNTNKTDGPATVIFTKQYFVAKVAGTPAIYLVEEGVKKPFSDSAVFKQMGWQFSQVRRVPASFLNNLPTVELAN